MYLDNFFLDLSFRENRFRIESEPKYEKKSFSASNLFLPSGSTSEQKITSSRFLWVSKMTQKNGRTRDKVNMEERERDIERERKRERERERMRE